MKELFKIEPKEHYDHIVYKVKNTINNIGKCIITKYSKSLVIAKYYLSIETDENNDITIKIAIQDIHTNNNVFKSPTTLITLDKFKDFKIENRYASEIINEINLFNSYKKIEYVYLPEKDFKNIKKKIEPLLIQNFD